MASSLIDIGVNLTHTRFQDSLPEVLQRAESAGVSGILITGTSEQESANALDIATQFPNQCWSTAGVHPHDAANVSEDWRHNLRQLAAQEKVKAIGECGLDFNRNFSPQEKQIEVFKGQLELAYELNMPLFLHERDAFDVQIEILTSHSALRGVAHCFTGTTEQMLTYLDLGLYVGITGWLCDAKRGESLREAVLELPLERLMIETDSPYLTPKGLKDSEGKKVRTNEPCYLPFIAEAIAQLKGVEVSEVIETSTQNANSLFHLEYS